MASLFIKDSATNSQVEEMAERLGVSKTEAVRRALAEMKANLERIDHNRDAPSWLQQFWRDHPLPAPTGLKADKPFFDDLSGEP